MAKATITLTDDIDGRVSCVVDLEPAVPPHGTGTAAQQMAFTMLENTMAVTDHTEPKFTPAAKRVQRAARAKGEDVRVVTKAPKRKLSSITSARKAKR